MTDDALPVRRSLDDEAGEWVERFAMGRGSRADMEALKQWMARSPAHAEAFDRVSRTWSSLDQVGASLAARGLMSLPRASRSSVPPRAGLGRRAFIGGALAASAAGVAAVAGRPPLGLWPSLSELRADLRTHAGEQRQIALDSHVSIGMNTRTSVIVHTAGAEAEIVAGEAMVSSLSQGDKPFTLLAAGGRVLASGGRFNVRVDDDLACITCVAGTVRVERGEAAVSLAASQQVTYSGGGMGKPASVNLEVVTAWQDGIVIFDAAPVSEVIAEVNRYRPGKIILTNTGLGRRLFSARLRIENIGYVVRQIELAFDARARALPGGIVLLG